MFRGEGVEVEVEEFAGPGAGDLPRLLGNDDLGNARELLGVEHEAKNDGGAFEDVENIGVLAGTKEERVIGGEKGRVHRGADRPHFAVYIKWGNRGNSRSPSCGRFGTRCIGWRRCFLR